MSLSISAKESKIIHLDNLINRELIGEGSFGRILKANLKIKVDKGEKLELVAIKMLKTATRAQIFSERSFLSDIDHPNVVKLVGMVLPNDDIPWLVVEYLSGGDLRSFILDSIDISEDTKIKIAWGAAKGMEYLHKNNIIHGDLAARNCLMAKADLQVKIGDLGYYCVKNADHYFEYGNVTIPCPVRWMAPENLPYEFSRYGNFFRRKHGKSLRGDAWSFGVLLFEIWSHGKIPFEGQSNYQVCKALLNETKPSDMIDLEMNDRMWKLLNECWNFDPFTRISFNRIVRYFSEYEPPGMSYDEAEESYYAGSYIRHKFTQVPDEDDYELEAQYYGWR